MAGQWRYFVLAIPYWAMAVQNPDIVRSLVMSDNPNARDIVRTMLQQLSGTLSDSELARMMGAKPRYIRRRWSRFGVKCLKNVSSL